MIPKLAKYSQCSGCGACAASCNVGALTMDYDKNGHLMPIVDESKCIKCGKCTKSCPILNENRVNRNNPKDISTYTAWAKDNKVCMQATSGGVFSQLAIDFLTLPNATVYGAFLTDYNTCHHIEINDTKDLRLIVGTKYIQSDASKVFPSIRKHLKNNDPCLFCGTPCQVAGLLSFLGKTNTENLYTIELICHGVPNKITTDIACKYYGATNIVSYRDKTKGHKKGFSCTYKNSKGELLTFENCFFSQIFGSTDRLSCYRCKYARIDRVADLTLGDQWGLHDKYPQRHNLGSNLVMCNSKKGERLLTANPNIEKDLNKNVTLNAPTLFMPIQTGATSNTAIMCLVRHLPVKMQFNILTNNWRKALYLIPWMVLKRVNRFIYERRFKAKLLKVRTELGWINDKL